MSKTSRKEEDSQTPACFSEMQGPRFIAPSTAPLEVTVATAGRMSSLADARSRKDRPTQPIMSRLDRVCKHFAVSPEPPFRRLREGGLGGQLEPRTLSQSVLTPVAETFRRHHAAFPAAKRSKNG